MSLGESPLSSALRRSRLDLYRSLLCSVTILLTWAYQEHSVDLRFIGCRGDRRGPKESRRSPPVAPAFISLQSHQEASGMNTADLIEAIDQEVARLQQARNLLHGGGGGVPFPFANRIPGKRVLSGSRRRRGGGGQSRRGPRNPKCGRGSGACDGNQYVARLEQNNVDAAAGPAGVEVVRERAASIIRLSSTESRLHLRLE